MLTVNMFLLTFEFQKGKNIIHSPDIGIRLKLGPLVFILHCDYNHRPKHS